ncbi:aromatic amino acid lyase [Desulfatitalea tepidiphila]|uniref:aromatic amino acid lyase n=1 Tax=Desulfatitalea tepidiphila TaxID=1185843 RepID=UPI0006B67394|nr:aromatic amino acid lyase [Desulfatitalea tepidiphila]
MKATRDPNPGSLQHEIVLSDGDVSIDEVIAVAFEGRRVRLSQDPAYMAKLRKSREILERSLTAGHRIYGVSTGVGYSSHRTVDPDHLQAFAYQIIRQHGCGLGEMFSEQEARAIVFTRIVSLAKGHSAVPPELLEALCGLLNQGVVPVIPKLGSVGASGDLTPLSYVAAVLAGEREVYYQGDILPAAEALERAGLGVHLLPPRSPWPS